MFFTLISFNRFLRKTVNSYMIEPEESKVITSHKIYSFAQEPVEAD